MRWSLPLSRLALAGLAILAEVSLATRASGQAHDAGAPSATASSGTLAPSVSADPRVTQIRAFLDGTLDVDVSPQSLVDVPLSDEAAIQVEATRLRALLRSADGAAQSTPAPAPGARAAATATPDATRLREELETIDASAWARRLEVDRARLELYALAADRRAELMSAHAARQEAARPREGDEERRARQAEEERQQALATAKAARTEAERLVSEELARLIALEARVAAVRGGLRDAREQAALRRDGVLGWQRRGRDAIASGPATADATYDALQQALGSSRNDLGAALGTLSDKSTQIPTLDADGIINVPPDIATQHVRERRASVERAIADASRDEQDLRDERASMLLDELSALNHERLALLPHLSSDKRDAITGFTSAGWAQARAETRQLSLVLRYHLHVARTWVTSLRTGDSSAISIWTAAALTVPLLILTVAFVWGRRRSQALLTFIEARIDATERTEGRLSPSVTRRVVRVLSRTHRSLESVAFFGVVMWLLPSGALALVEVQLVSAAVGWILAGALVVNLINALAAGSASALTNLGDDAAGLLRLRSLRLVGRTVVAFTLVLILSAQLVDRGTIYSWVFSTCWFAAIPIFLLLVRWWRGTVFERLERGRKKTPLQAWILMNRSGWKSFLAAMIGALQLFGTGVFKTVRSWLSGFDVARRAHAYLFKRELERIGEGQARAERAPLDGPALEHLHPERPFTRWIACPSDEVRDAIDGRIRQQRGGLVAVVGARGMGKSSLFRALAPQEREVIAIPCTSKTTLSDLRAATQALHARSARQSPSNAPPHVVLLDDAHALIKACIGGLALFDEVLALARAHGRGPTWVFALDAAVWPLLRRARDSQPLFDEVHTLAPWTERQIGALLADRCEGARISPTYEDLLEKLPPGSDELDRQDALEAKRTGYERMLWDHVGGNPALALEAWRASLARDASGVVHVCALQEPDLSALERLSSSSLFVLRTVLQLAPASIEAVAEATRLPPGLVLQDVRFGQAKGFFSEHDGLVRVAWPWLRAVTRLLSRRHLLELS
jgi:hypothetical protein